MSQFYKNIRLSHLSRGDAYLWSKFIDKYPDTFFDIKYDVRVGLGVILPQEYPEWLKKSADFLSKKRIDVVGETKRHIFVIEIRVNAKSNVIGDLLSYKYLYELSFKPIKKVLPFLISNTLEADLLITLRELKINYIIV